MGDYGELLWRSFLTAWRDPTGVGTYAVIATVVMLGFGILYMLAAAIDFFRSRKMTSRRKLRQFIRVMKGKRMTPQDREEYERFLIEDFITTGLEEMYFLGQITREKRDWWYEYFAQKLKMDGLVRSVKIGVKDQIKKRMRRDAGKNVIPFPDPTPVEPEKKVYETIPKFKGGIFTKRA